MADDLTPSDIRARKFALSRRGYDRSEVSDFLNQVADRLGSLDDELSSLSQRLDQLGIADLPDLKNEMDDLGVEIQAVLNAAMTAAEGLRTRAHADAAELAVEAETASQAARNDAWVAGTDLLDQADREADRMIVEAREDALFIRAEAEQDAKRLIADSRRQADELLRSSRDDAERIVVIAKAESEAILEGARQSAEKAQERARALENRRSELLGELEAAESAIRDVETAQAGGGEPDIGIRVIAGDSSAETRWPDNDGAVRILPAVEPSALPSERQTVDAEAMAAEVAQMRSAVTMPQTAEAGEMVDIDIHDEPVGDDALQDVAVVPSVDRDPAAERLLEESTDTVLMEADEIPTAKAVEPADVVPASDAEPADPTVSADATMAVDEVEPTLPAAEDAAKDDVAKDDVAKDDVAKVDVAKVDVAKVDVATDKVTVVSDDPGIGALFAKLRQTPEEPAAVVVETPQELAEEIAIDFAEEPAVVSERPALEVVPPVAVAAGFDRRDRMLLPIENRGLRGLKRRIVELQNRVLEELRTSDGQWRLSRAFVIQMMGDELDAVLRDSFRAGHAAAAESVDAVEPQVTGGPKQGAAETLTGDLHRDVRTVIERDDGAGSRRLSSDVGRVFRSWRTDEAERHVRQAARRAFNDGLLAGYRRLGVDAVEVAAPGRPCGECSADSGLTWRPGEDLPAGAVVPPANSTCSAMIVVAGSNGFDSRPGQ